MILIKKLQKKNVKFNMIKLAEYKLSEVLSKFQIHDRYESVVNTLEGGKNNEIVKRVTDLWDSDMEMEYSHVGVLHKLYVIKHAKSNELFDSDSQLFDIIDSLRFKNIKKRKLEGEVWLFKDIQDWVTNRWNKYINATRKEQLIQTAASKE